MPLFGAQEIADWSGGTWSGPAPETFSGVSTDTRAVRGNELFIAIRGPNHDGHDFVEEAFKRGARGAVVRRDRAVSPASRGPLLAVDDPAQALRAMAQGYRRALRAKTIAVTGSSGKTTVKEMVADVCASIGKTARSPGNWNNEIGLPLSLMSAERDVQFGVFELGMNHPGELAPLCAVLMPDWGIVTNVGPVHLEFFDSIEAIAREKAEVPASLPREGIAFLDRDGPCYEILSKAALCRVTTVSLGLDADVSAEIHDPGRGLFTVRESATGETADFCLSIPGRHMIADSLFAIAVGRALGVGWSVLVQVLAAFRPLPLRWTRVTINGVDVVNDAYNANPMSMVAALEAFSRLETSGRKWLVLGGMRELGAAEEAEHARLGRLVAQGAWSGLIVVGRLGALIAQSARTGPQARLDTYGCADHREAAAVLKKLVAPGDAVLLKASRAEALERVMEEWAGAGMMGVQGAGR